jgi:acetylcholinesterase
LNANIVRPWKRPAGKNLPVVINFYGGAFNYGQGPQRHIPGLVGWSSAAIIGVTFNYRIGALGFLPSKLTEKEGLLNVGLKDQRLLLEWVRDNIEDFGGDKNDVTLMGVSAGAHSVCVYVYFHTIPSCEANFGPDANSDR